MPLSKSSELKRRRLSNANRQKDDFISIGESCAIQEPEIVTEQEPEIVTEQEPDIKSDDSVSYVEMHPVIKPEYSQKYKYR